MGFSNNVNDSTKHTAAHYYYYTSDVGVCVYKNTRLPVQKTTTPLDDKGRMNMMDQLLHRLLAKLGRDSAARITKKHERLR